MSTIIFTRVEFNYTSPYSEIFSDLSLILDSTWRSGLVGRNGRGKTTFLKLLDGELEPVSGEITNTLSTRYFPGDVPAKGQSTLVVIRNLIAPYDLWESEMARLLELSDPDSLEAYSQLQSQYQDARGYKINGLIEREIQKMGLSREVLDRPFEVLSLGQQTQIQIVSLFLGQPTFALIDEPTNHLDIECRKALGDYLSQQHGFLLVSHDRALLNACTDHIISINRSDVRVNQGNWSTWRDEMEKELLSEARSRSQIESEVKQLQRTAQQRRQGADQKESEKYGNSHADTGFIGHKAAKGIGRISHIYGYSARYTFRPNQSWLYSLIKSGGY
ncbi:MAG: ABC-F family ATP-binding cassette domain-containing protein [Gammaproteobacteria bacterium]|nr:ABC-F family ATP-binding cassette domain-containing protein [Gammaproteobacteria bacterium]